MDAAAILQFLGELEENNDRAWFDEHRATYKGLRKDYTGFLGELAATIAFFDPAVQLWLGDPKLVKVFRINRDLRFSKDKRPYKTNFGGIIGLGDGRPLYYLSLEVGSSMAGGGLYMPPAPVLKSIREKVAEKHEELRTILADPAFAQAFPGGLTSHDALKTAPRGYSTDHPAIDLLRHKSFAATRPFSDAQVADQEFFDDVLTTFEAISKLNAFLDSTPRQ